MVALCTHCLTLVYPLPQISSEIDKLLERERWSVGNAAQKIASIQYQFWNATSRNLASLIPILERLKNRVAKDKATAEGKPFDSNKNPTDARFIGRQINQVGD